MGSSSPAKTEYKLPEPKIVEQKRLRESQIEAKEGAYTGETGEQTQQRMRGMTTLSLEEAQKPRNIYTYGGRTLLG